MIEEQAIVVRLDGTRAHLEIERSRPCGLCGATRGCGVSLWGRLFGHRNQTFSVDNGIGATAGERVVIGVEEGILLSGALNIYGVPLVLLCLGALLGSSLATARAAGDLYAVCGAATGLLLGLMWIRLRAAGDGQSGRHQPVMLRRAESVAIRHCSR